jgi:AmmeMemoRadiSam system protein B
VDDERIPALRPVEIVPVQHEGQELMLLRDPHGVATEPLLLSPASLALLRLLDGEHSVRDIQAAIARATGQIVPSEAIREFVGRLDERCYLDSLAYLERRRELSLEYARAPHRAAQFAGLAYPDEAAALHAQLNAFYTAPEAPGLPSRPVPQAPAGLAAPHIDPARGGAIYAQAYQHLWGATPRTLIVLGVAHAGSPQPFIVTGKDYATPLGLVPTRRALAQDLAARLDWDPFANEEAHRWEHSIEFQILFAQHALTCGGRVPWPEGTHCLPILCAFGWQDVAGEAAEGRARIDHFLDVLRGLLAAEEPPVVILAGADLAHVGRRFGDPHEISDAACTRVRQRDLATLGLLSTGAREEFVAEIIGERDGRRWCGFSALYSLRALLPTARGSIAGYGQSVDAEQGSVVSFPALVFECA